jgi:membrane protein required for colicin V production
MFNAATPKDLQPHWIVGSTTWPLAQDMGKLVARLTPQGLDLAGRLKPAFDSALHKAKHDAIDDRLKSEGYDARQRREIEDLVEKSR